MQNRAPVTFLAAPLALDYEERVPPSGYDWYVWEEHPTTRHLLLRPISGRGSWAGYRPLTERKTLYRQFADIDRGTTPTPEGIVGFANENGSLGVAHDLKWPPRRGPRGEKGSRKASWERLETWQSEIAVMRHATRVWDALTDEAASVRLSRDKIRKWFSIRPFPGGPPLGVFTPSADKVPDDAYRGFQSDPPDDLDPDESNRSDDLDPEKNPGMMGEGLRGEYAWWYPYEESKKATSSEIARSFLSDVTSTRLKQHCELALFHFEDSSLRVGATPRNLLGAMWLQFTLAIQGEAKHVQCLECGSWFVVPRSKRGMAQRARFCKDSCRVKHFRKKKRPAPQR